MKARGWLGYLVGGMLFSNGFAGTGMVVFGVGMIADWKLWLMAIFSFCVGFSWT
jgi:hypothetical protein